ncbi:MAG: hypothetical protein R2702_18565 [Acidimicrobiales bacterium]
MRDVPAEALLVILDERGVAASPGSSCASGAARPSHVVEAIGVEDPWRRGACACRWGGAPPTRRCAAAAVVGDAVAELQRAVAGAGR